MTQLRQVEADGTRVYQSRKRYKPKPVEERLIGINRPDDPRAVRFHTRWFLPIEVLEEDSRGPLPETRPDTDAYDHMGKKGHRCRCLVCRRPSAERWKRKWRKERGLRS